MPRSGKQPEGARLEFRLGKLPCGRRVFGAVLIASVIAHTADRRTKTGKRCTSMPTGSGLAASPKRRPEVVLNPGAQYSSESARSVLTTQVR